VILYCLSFRSDSAVFEVELELVFKCFVLFGVLAGSFDEDFGAFEQVEDEAFEAFSETEVGDF